MAVMRPSSSKAITSMMSTASFSVAEVGDRPQRATRPRRRRCGPGRCGQLDAPTPWPARRPRTRRWPSAPTATSAADRVLDRGVVGEQAQVAVAVAGAEDLDVAVDGGVDLVGGGGHGDPPGVRSIDDRSVRSAVSRAATSLDASAPGVGRSSPGRDGTVGERVGGVGQHLGPQDQARAAIPGEVVPRPVDEHRHPVAHAEQVDEVQAEPRQPGDARRSA